MTALDEVTENFREQFHQLSDSDLSRLTMRKQCLSETTNFLVLSLVSRLGICLGDVAGGH